MGGTPGRSNYGLLGASSGGGARQEGLAPYAGMQRGLLPGTPGRGGDDPALVLSQEGGLQLSQEAPQQQQQQQQQRFVPTFSQQVGAGQAGRAGRERGRARSGAGTAACIRWRARWPALGPWT